MYPSADVVVVLGPAQDAERTRHVNSARALDCGPRHAAGGENETGVQRDATRRFRLQAARCGPNNRNNELLKL